jgi:hypothetical protein
MLARLCADGRVWPRGARRTAARVVYYRGPTGGTAMLVVPRVVLAALALLAVSDAAPQARRHAADSLARCRADDRRSGAGRMRLARLSHERCGRRPLGRSVGRAASRAKRPTTSVPRQARPRSQACSSDARLPLSSGIYFRRVPLTAVLLPFARPCTMRCELPAPLGREGRTSGG